MATCIFCNSPDSLNTVMTITVDGDVKVSVSVCDADAEDATPKLAREAYTKRQRQIEEVMAQARALGLDLSAQQPTQSIMVMQSIKPAATAPVQTPVQADPTVADPFMNEDDGDVISTSLLMKPMRSVGGSASNGGVSSNVQAYASHSMDELGSGVLGGKAKVTVVEGRAGQPLQLPSVIRDGTGTTRLRVSRSLDDHGLQRRFKSMADSSRGDVGPDFRNGYEENTERECPICRGAGTAVNMGRPIACPKCSGVGFIVI